MLYHWTPEIVLDMPALLFFAMLSKGRMIEHRKRFRNYYELCRVAGFPHYSQEYRQEVTTYYFNNTLSSEEIENHYRRGKEQEASDYISPKDAENFFRGIAGGLYGGRRH